MGRAAASLSTTTATIPALDGDWTIAGWVWATSVGGSSQGKIVSTYQAANPCQYFGFSATAGRLEAAQWWTTTPAAAVSSVGLPLGAWAYVAATYVSGGVVRLYYGDLQLAVNQFAYSFQGGGTGVRRTGGTNLIIGAGGGGGSQGWDGRLERLTLWGRVLTVPEMDLHRLGSRPVQDQAGSLRAFYPMDSPTASRVEDLSGNGANATVGGLTVIEGPSVPSNPLGVW